MEKELYISGVKYQCLTMPNIKYGAYVLCKH